VARALLIASNEICYNPRLLKSADCLLARGIEVWVFNGVPGVASPELYADVVASRSWRVHAVDTSKRSLASRINWLTTALASRLARLLWERARVDAALPYVFNRSLVRFPWRTTHFDYIVVNLVDNLPFAARLKTRTGGALIYDSQELFSGQSADTTPEWRQWVKTAEQRHLPDTDIIFTTTQAMADELSRRFPLQQPVVRVRNAPLQSVQREPAATPAGLPLRLIWHGFAVNYSGRGVDLILEALAQCHEPVTLTLQGRLSPAQRELIEANCARLGVLDRVSFAPPAHPERIVESLVGFDAGVIAETGADDNQKVTSSNKLFEYVHAGLCVIAPALPGLVETVGDGVGLLYGVRNATELGSAIDRLASDRVLLRTLRQAARDAAPSMTWQTDFDAAWELAGFGASTRPGQPFDRVESVGLLSDATA